MAASGYLAKIKKKSRASFWFTLSARFIHRNVLYLTLSMDKFSMSHHISFSGYQTKCVVKFLFIQLLMSQRLFFNQPLNQWLTERKKIGAEKYTKN